MSATIKKILLPTDFSETSLNALEYAFRLAASLGAELCILHAYQNEVLGGMEGTPIVLQSVSADEKGNLCARIKRQGDEIKERTGCDVVFSCEVSEGEAITQILMESRDRKADLIVMGTMGERSLLGKLLGSVSTAVLRDADTPVLVIPPHAKWSPPKKILFALDLHRKSLRTHYQLALLAHRLGAKVLAVHMAANEEESKNAALLEDMNRGSMEFGSSELIVLPLASNPSQAINHYAAESGADWMAIVPRRRSFFADLFHHSMARDLAARCQIPILGLHEEQ